MMIQISINLNIFPTQETKMNQLVLLTNQTPGVVTFENWIYIIKVDTISNYALQ